MHIEIKILDERGLVGATLRGTNTRVEHVVAFEKVHGLVERGELAVLVVDGRLTQAPSELSLTHEMWNGAMSALGGRPVAYVPPADFTPRREAVIRSAAAEWGCLVTFHTTHEEATTWALDHLAPH